MLSIDVSAVTEVIVPFEMGKSVTEMRERTFGEKAGRDMIVSTPPILTSAVLRPEESVTIAKAPSTEPCHRKSS
jgi:hypothetical protein